MRTAKTWPVALLAGTLLATASAGCAKEDDTAPGDGAKPRTIKAVEGCGPGAWTDPADLSADRKPARCAKGAPAPQPLQKKRRITVATGTLSAEYVAPLQMAVKKGEFAKEGLDVRVKVLPTRTRCRCSPRARSPPSGPPPRPR